MRAFLAMAALLFALPAAAGDLEFSDPANLPPPPPDAPGFPASDAGLDALEGFASPPPGYGEVPFWWWTGDPLDKERLLWQLDKLHAAGIPGVQINYAHDPAMVTYPAEPPIFSEPWWEIWRWMAGECRKRGMGIGLSGYTIDWPGHDNLFRKIGVNDGSLRGAHLRVKTAGAKGRTPFSMELPGGVVSATARRMEGKKPEPGPGTDLLDKITGNRLEWTPPKGLWQVAVVYAESPEWSVDPMNPASGAKVIERFFQPFADHCPGDLSKALNYFFHDELTFGVDGWLWNGQFAAEFKKRKGYDILPLLPALFIDIGPETPKVRLDCADVMVSLEEENFFRPIFEWHWSRGIMYACDPGSRGKNPSEFGDYFRCVRWYAAPGHDTPGGKADLIKDKVSSSMAHLYRRPRVWLEGYHSLGWGATPATIFDSSCKNFLYGASLLNLHGLYYTTHGGHWEWAPPCFHFRMPYWEHMGSFMKYFERLGYLLSQGAHRCDVAVMYPVAPLEAGMGGEKTVAAAFETGTRLYMDHGIDFDFMDFESLARAEIRDRQLLVSGEAYRVLVLPGMAAARWSTVEKALAFYRAGGVVIATGALPAASDRAGREDAELDKAVREIFGVTAAGARNEKKTAPQRNDAGGTGAAADSDAAVAALISASIPRDFIPGGGGQVLHRKIGERDVYMVMGAPKNSECFFRARGAVELWDPWTGTARPVRTFTAEGDGTRVRMPLGADEAQVIVFSPGDAGTAVTRTDLDEVAGVETRDGKPEVTGYAAAGGEKTATVLAGGVETTVRGVAADPAPPVALDGDWEVELEPKLDNRWGDFRLPVAERMIGAEARRFAHAEETAPNPGWEKADLDDSSWKTVACSFGTRFWKLGPMPETTPEDGRVAALTRVNPGEPVTVGGAEHRWQPYDYSTRWGVEGDPGPQGHHGLKKLISDDFIVLGAPKYNGISIDYQKEEAGGRHYLWTTALAPRDGAAVMRTGAMKPAAVWINGVRVEDLAAAVPLHAGANPVLLRYDTPGRTHFILELEGAPAAAAPAVPLSMRWHNNPAVLPFDPKPDAANPAGWYRFLSPPGLRSMRITARGAVSAWADGVPVDMSPGAVRADGAVEYTATVAKPAAGAVRVALRVEQERGCLGGAALPEPVALDCGPGVMPAGDWSKMGALADYSGGMWYRRTVTLTKERVAGRVVLDLGAVAASAEVRVNGKPAGIKITPPWRVDLSGLVKPGKNKIEILVCNTLANHYGAIPTHYRGDPVSGLLGPVVLRTEQPVVLR